jgi:transposase
MNEVTHTLGIDVSKQKLDLALLDVSSSANKPKVKSKVMPNTPDGHQQLQQWLLEQGAQKGGSHICLEATGPYGDTVAQTLVDAGWIVSVVNPARVKGFAQSQLQRNKNDKADAQCLARFCAALRPEPWTPPPLPYRQLRAWVDRLQELKAMKTQESNRLEAHCVRQEHELMAHVKTHIDWLDQQIHALQHQIDDHIDRHPQLRDDARLIESINGIGAVSASKVLAYMGDVRRFKSAKALAAFVGVTPRQRLSGTSLRGRTQMARMGLAQARTALYMPGLVARQHNPALKCVADRLESNGLAKKAVIGAMMRKLVHLIYAVVKSGVPFDPTRHLNKLDFQDGI